MAGATVTYKRNYDSSDSTSTGARYTTGDPLPTIEACGWEPPSGYQFKEWNTARDGTGLSFQPGDMAPSNDSMKFAIWEPIPVPYLVMESDLTAVADAIREKGGTSDALEWPDEFVDAIDAIPTGGNEHIIVPRYISDGNITWDKDKASQGETITLTNIASSAKTIEVWSINEPYTGGTSCYTRLSIHNNVGVNQSITFTMPATHVAIVSNNK